MSKTKLFLDTEKTFSSLDDFSQMCRKVLLQQLADIGKAQIMQKDFQKQSQRKSSLSEYCSVLKHKHFHQMYFTVFSFERKKKNRFESQSILSVSLHASACRDFLERDSLVKIQIEGQKSNCQRHWKDASPNVCKISI